MSKINRKFFFTQVRLHLFDGSMTSNQVRGLTAILDAWEQQPMSYDDRWLAYMLATAHHETNRAMLPIAEYGGNEYKRRNYDVTGDNPARARKYGNTKPGDGIKYAGRGYVQLTWFNNYKLAGNKLSIGLLLQPDLAMQPDIAANIMLVGMREGWFTGKKLRNYFTPEKSDWKGARKIINGTDKNALIASYGIKYYAAISYTV